MMVQKALPLSHPHSRARVKSDNEPARRVSTVPWAGGLAKSPQAPPAKAKAVVGHPLEPQPENGSALKFAADPRGGGRGGWAKAQGG